MALSHCTGPCAQGRLPCPTPNACRLPEWPPLGWVDRWLIVAVYGASALTSIAAVALVLSMLGVL